MLYDVELTDTFNNEANYSWVKRAQVEVNEDESDLVLVRKAKAALEVSGVRARKTDYGDMIRLDFCPSWLAVMFITVAE